MSSNCLLVNEFGRQTQICGQQMNQFSIKVYPQLPVFGKNIDHIILARPPSTPVQNCYLFCPETNPETIHTGIKKGEKSKMSISDQQKERNLGRNSCYSCLLFSKDRFNLTEFFSSFYWYKHELIKKRNLISSLFRKQILAKLFIWTLPKIRYQDEIIKNK